MAFQSRKACLNVEHSLVSTYPLWVKSRRFVLPALTVYTLAFCIRNGSMSRDLRTSEGMNASRTRGDSAKQRFQILSLKLRRTSMHLARHGVKIQWGMLSVSWWLSVAAGTPLLLQQAFENGLLQGPKRYIHTQRHQLSSCCDSTCANALLRHYRVSSVTRSSPCAMPAYPPTHSCI